MKVVTQRVREEGKNRFNLYFFFLKNNRKTTFICIFTHFHTFVRPLSRTNATVSLNASGSIFSDSAPEREKSLHPKGPRELVTWKPALV